MSAIRLSESLLGAVQARCLMLDGASLETALSTISKAQPAEWRAAVQSVTYSATRHYLLADTILQRLAQRKPSPRVQQLLLVALSQLLDEADKTYMIVNETIEAAKKNLATAKASGFINAVLRRFCRERDALIAQALTRKEARFNAPRWWIEKMERDLGKNVAHHSLELMQQRPPLCLRVNRRKGTVAQWIALASAQNIKAIPMGRDGVIITPPLPVHLIPGFQEGWVSVQDAGAQLAAQFLNPQAGENILDACAAPGGKTAHLLEIADCHVTAIEIDPLRAQRIQENLDRLHLRANVLTTNAGDVSSWWNGKSFDSILLDAPCTASGIGRRHPDVPFSRRPQDISELAKQQATLLNALWPLVKVGGKLLYVVCSVFREEGKDQVEQFLKVTHNAKPLTLIEGQPASLTLISTDKDPCHALPSVHDGFFYALFEKTC